MNDEEKTKSYATRKEEPNPLDREQMQKERNLRDREQKQYEAWNRYEQDLEEQKQRQEREQMLKERNLRDREQMLKEWQKEQIQKEPNPLEREQKEKEWQEEWQEREQMQKERNLLEREQMQSEWQKQWQKAALAQVNCLMSIKRELLAEQERPNPLERERKECEQKPDIEEERQKKRDLPRDLALLGLAIFVALIIFITILSN